MESQANVTNPPQSMGLYKTLFVAFTAFAFFELCAIEKAAFHRGGGIWIAFEVGTPWLMILGFGAKIWRTAKQNEVDAKSLGPDLMYLGLLALVFYNAMEDVLKIY